MSTYLNISDKIGLQSTPNPSLLNLYGGAAAAYSLRKLDSFYNGDAIVVRRASDNTTQAIGFVNGELDTATLESFCSGTDGFVTTWYDQSGNNRNVTKTTATSQPQIVSSGTIITDNEKPAIQFSSEHAIKLQYAESELLSSNNSLFTMVYNPDTISRYNVFDSAEGNNFFLQTSSGDYKFNNGTALSLSQLSAQNQILALLDFNGSTLKSYFDGSNTSTHTSLSSIKRDGLTIGGHRTNDGSNGFVGKYQEFVYYNTNNNVNVNGIETNINNYYNIY